MDLPQEQFSFLADRNNLEESQIGYLTSRKNIFYDEQYFIVEKVHNDWASDHEYGMEIKRQHNIENNITLSSMKSSPNNNISRVIDYNDKFVVFEYIAGRLLDRSAIHLPPIGPDWVGLYEGHKCMPGDTFLKETSREEKHKWNSQIISGINHLHSIGVCHTDLTLFNIMIEESTDNIKIIDLLSCVPSSNTFKELDWWCYNKYIKPRLLS